MKFSTTAVRCLQVTVICATALLATLLANYNAPEKQVYLGQSCLRCEDSVQSEMTPFIESNMVLVAQEVNISCCAMLGYIDEGHLLYCHHPRLVSWSSQRVGLQNFHCGDLQLFTFYDRVKFACNNIPEPITITNSSLANAYTVAFALMYGFNCS